MLFALLAARQLWIQGVAAPGLAANRYNPRDAVLSRYRGSIVASDGTVLAATTNGRRVYPLGASLAQTVGYLSARYGATGLEEAYDRVLSAPQQGVDPLSQLRAIGDAIGGHHRTPRGDDVVTTIEPAVQAALVDGLAAHARAAGIAIDPRTGAVLAIASRPSFDPNRLAAIFPSLVDDPASPLLNRALNGLYPPGSTFKIVIASAALGDGVVTPETTFYDPGYLRVGNFTVHDNEGEATGTQDLAGAFALSSNVDFAKIGLKLGVDGWESAVHRFGFGEPTGFALPVSRDRIPAAATITPSILAQLSFGQADLLVTPMRMALVAATIASGGREPRPYIVRAVRGPNGRTLSTATDRALARPVDAQVAAEVRALMIAVVRSGTGTAAALPAVTVAGKTGTATNASGAAHAWFVAFAPALAPRIAVAVIVENGGYGGTVSAPIARSVMAAALSAAPRISRRPSAHGAGGLPVAWRPGIGGKRP